MDSYTESKKADKLRVGMQKIITYCNELRRIEQIKREKEELEDYEKSKESERTNRDYRIAGDL